MRVKLVVVLSAVLWLIVCPMTRSAKSRGRVMRSYDIRIQRIGKSWMGEVQHAWSPEGVLPGLWYQIQEDPTVVQAVVHYAQERNKMSTKRRILDSFKREDVVATPLYYGG